MIETNFLSVRAPRWSNENHTAIDCFVTTNTLKTEVPFTASPNDVEPYGRKLFARCIAGEFGPIASWLSNSAVSATGAALEMPLWALRLIPYLQATNSENALKSNRGIIVVWASVLQNLLDQLLERDAAQSGAFSRPPKTFGDAIDRASKRALVDQADYARLDHIRKIRN